MCCWSPIKNCFIPDETIPNFKPLVCIDFDGTLADGDSLVNALDQISISRYYFPIDFPKANNFIGLQGREAGPREQLLDEAIRAMQLADGMEEMIVALHRKGAELIIVSDNIDVIVDRFLQAKGIRQYFSSILTHKARFNSEDVLELRPHQLQFTCRDSNNFMCKAKVVRQFISRRKEKAKFYPVVFIGDGLNDYCAMASLKSRDLACVRKDSKLEDNIKLKPEVRKSISAKIIFWTNAIQILEEIEKMEQ